MKNPFEELDEEMEEVKPSPALERKVKGSYNSTKGILSFLDTMTQKMGSMVIGFLRFFDPVEDKNSLMNNGFSDFNDEDDDKLN